jgi:hypothetical protein
LLGHFEPGQALGAETFDPFGQLIDLRAGHGRAALVAKRAHHAARRQGAREHLETRLGEHRGHVEDLHVVAQVRLVGTVAAHGFLVGEAGERRFHVDADAFFEHGLDEALDEADDVVLLHERHLQVDLRELELAVGALVLVAETAGDLVILVEPGHHEELFEKLGRLRQGVETAVRHARRHQEVPRAFRRGLGEERRLKLQEPLLRQEIPRGRRDLVAQDQVLLQRRAAQVEITMPQADILVRRGKFRYFERRRLALVQNGDGFHPHFDLPRAEVRIFGPCRPRPHFARDLEHVFRADRLRLGEHVLAVRMEHQLHQPLAVPQVDEHHASVVAPVVHPARQNDLLPDVVLPDLPAINRAFHVLFLSWSENIESLRLSDLLLTLDDPTHNVS